jgi:glycosyltransferase involved in cell wall biosynthesis
MGNPKLSVVIPTRDRADTLYYSMKTVTEQEYQNLEIIVSDNASIDNTKEVVSQFSDSRIKYINTGTRLGMSENWEFALGHVTGDYVMYLGDDDGLLPNTCFDVAQIINNTDCKALVWDKPSYLWPSILDSPCLISMQCNYDLCEINSKMLLKAVVSGRTSYGKLPMFYSGFISMSVVEKILKKSTKFFHSISPDVYSGLVLADELTSHLYSYRPFSISGGSIHSTGISSVTNDVKAKIFLTEGKIPVNDRMPIIRGSLQSHIAESILQAKAQNLLVDIHFNYNRIHQNIYNEVVNLPDNLKIEGLEILSNLNLNRKNHKLIHQALISTRKEMGTVKTDKSGFFNQFNYSNASLSFRSSKYGIINSYEACNFIATLLGPYSMPSIIKKVNYFSLAILFVRRFLSSKFNRYYLPE